MFKRLSAMLLSVLFLFHGVHGESENMNIEITQTSILGSITETDAYINYSSFFDYVEDNFIIPGLLTDMCPQGMCKARDYILISAYDPYKEVDSCIYVLDMDGNYLKVVRIKDNKSHVGGIAFDGEYVYTSNSTTSSITKIPLDDILTAENEQTINCINIDIRNIKGKEFRASYCTYDKKNDILWVGIYEVLPQGYACGYKINGNTAELVAFMDLPRFVQGLLIDNDEIYCSSSYGVFTPSHIRKYKRVRKEDEDGVMRFTYKNEHEFDIDIPPGVENIFIDNGYLYVLFESASDQFYNNAYKSFLVPAFDPVDSICKYKLN